MNWYSIFYWITVADGVKKFFDAASNLFTTASIISMVILVICMIGRSVCIADCHARNADDENTSPLIRAWNRIVKIVKPLFFIFLGLSLVTWAGYAFTPSKKDALIIVAGGTVSKFLTSDSSAKQIPSEVFTLLRDKIRQEIRETNIGNTVSDTLVGKSREELIEIIQNKK